MRILHIGYGYFPIAAGGATRYAMDLMAAQAALGHDVSYLCSDRYDLLFRTRLRRWTMGKVKVFSILNPPSQGIPLAGITRPEIDVRNARVDKLARQVIAEIRPEIAHIQIMVGWPASLIDVLDGCGVPAIYTVELQEALCPQKKLYDLAADETCADFADGRRCVRCNQGLPEASFLVNATRFRVAALATFLPGLFGALRAAKRKLLPRKPAAQSGPLGLPGESRLADAFRARRRAYVDALNRIEIVAGMSRRVNEILAQHGVNRERLRTQHLTLGDLDMIVRRAPRTPSLPIRFGLLNKITHLKGGTILAKAFAGMDPKQARLSIYGNQSADAVAMLQPLIASGVAELHGPYPRDQINAILDKIDVGLIPSICEEAYGFVGPEFLAGGVPILASRIGGMPDYVEEGVNGYLISPRDPEAWRAKFLELIANPAEVERLARGIKPVKTMQDHLPEIEALYREAQAIRNQRSASGTPGSDGHP